MSGRNTQRRSISEISHLFLSAVRDKQRGGAAPPRRTPPASAGQPDITPQELNEVTGRAHAGADEPGATPPVVAVVAWHLGERLLDSAKRYARNLAATGKRVAMVVLDVGELRLFTFDAGGEEDAADPAAGALPCLDVRAIRDAMGELRCDADCWLVVAGSVRAPEARDLLRRVGRWVVLTTSDADGVVNCYKALKGAIRPPMPRVSVAVLDAAGPAEAEAVFRRLAGACLQFLNLPLEAEPLLGDAFHVTECQALCCRADRDRTQTGLVAHFDVVARGLGLKECDTQDCQSDAAAAAPAPPPQEQAPAETAPARAAPVAEDSPPPRMVPMENNGIAEVIELPGDAAEQSVLEAVLRHAAGAVVPCPARPPACPSCCLVVGRDRRMILLAAAGRDLANLRHILRAWQWADENRQLLAMAMPQLAMDTSRPPLLELLVEEHRTDLSSVAGLFGSENVAVRFYRRVRWGGRAGLLLEAAA